MDNNNFDNSSSGEGYEEDGNNYNDYYNRDYPHRDITMSIVKEKNASGEEDEESESGELKINNCALSQNSENINNKGSINESEQSSKQRQSESSYNKINKNENSSELNSKTKEYYEEKEYENNEEEIEDNVENSNENYTNIESNNINIGGEEECMNDNNSIIGEKEYEDNKEINEYKEAFNIFDKDCDGYITITELKTVMRTLGQNPTQEELDEIVETYDDDKNGIIDLKEFMILMRNKLEEQKEGQELIQIFNMFDKDQDGLIDKNDIIYIITTAYEEDEEESSEIRNLEINIEEELLDEFFKNADKNKTGKISFSDFKRVMINKVKENKENK